MSEKPVTDYKILRAYTTHELETLVMQAMQDGYRTVGGIAINPDYFHQAVAR